MYLIARCSLLSCLAACAHEPQEPSVPLEPAPEEPDEEPELSSLPACQPDTDPVLELGTGGLSAFTPFAGGDSVALEVDGSGAWGLYVDLLAAGLDTTEPVIAMLRLSLGDDPATRDVGARLAMQCPDAGPGWAGVLVPFDESELEEIDGVTLHLTGLLTDWTGVTATQELELVLVAP
jgi:hypothetical protein